MVTYELYLQYYMYQTENMVYHFYIFLHPSEMANKYEGLE